MDEQINQAILEELQNAIQRAENNLERRVLRDGSDPFNVPDDIFLKYYRLTKIVVRNIIEMVHPYMQVPQRNTFIPLELKVLTLLHFVGHGSYQKCVGLNLNLCLEQSTVSKIICELTDCFVDNFLQRFVKFPETVEQENSIKQQFYDKFNFPGIIGAIDCTHIGIVAPPTDDAIRPGIVYYNRKGFHSLNVQMICDSNLQITNCNARFPGSVHDSAIWSMCSVKQLLQEKYINGNHNSAWLIGDSGYPLEPWLLTPVVNALPNTPEGQYTAAHIRARNCIERCFGCLKQRFRCLGKHRILHYNPVRAAKIVYTCVIFHNISFRERVPQPIDDIPQVEIVPPIVEVNENHVQNNRNEWHRRGLRVRNELVNNYFV